MADASSLATIASIISTFGVAMLLFRIQRELTMHEVGEINWIPWAGDSCDWQPWKGGYERIYSSA